METDNKQFRALSPEQVAQATEEAKTYDLGEPSELDQARAQNKELEKQLAAMTQQVHTQLEQRQFLAALIDHMPMNILLAELKETRQRNRRLELLAAQFAGEIGGDSMIKLAEVAGRAVDIQTRLEVAEARADRVENPTIVANGWMRAALTIYADKRLWIQYERDGETTASLFDVNDDLVLEDGWMLAEAALRGPTAKNDDPRVDLAEHRMLIKYRLAEQAGATMADHGAGESFTESIEDFIYTRERSGQAREAVDFAGQLLEPTPADTYLVGLESGESHAILMAASSAREAAGKYFEIHGGLKAHYGTSLIVVGKSLKRSIWACIRLFGDDAALFELGADKRPLPDQPRIDDYLALRIAKADAAERERIKRTVGG